MMIRKNPCPKRVRKRLEESIMHPPALPRRKKIVILCAAAAAAIAGVFLFMPPVAQDPAYHDFADKRSWLGMPNFGDVAGNAPFAVVGIWGLAALARIKSVFADTAAYRLWQVFFFGVFLVAFGSGYYHWAPDNHTLVWDRLPMTIAFMSLFALVILRHVHRGAGVVLFWPLLAIGTGSVFYWDYTEAAGAGDLRLYALVQFLPILLIPLILWLFPARESGMRHLLHALGFYLLAKVLEHFDAAFFDIAGQTVSGHTLKHPAAAAAVACLLPYARLFTGKDAAAV